MLGGQELGLTGSGGLRLGGLRLLVCGEELGAACGFGVGLRGRGGLPLGRDQLGLTCGGGLRRLGLGRRSRGGRRLRLRPDVLRLIVGAWAAREGLSPRLAGRGPNAADLAAVRRVLQASVRRASDLRAADLRAADLQTARPAVGHRAAVPPEARTCACLAASSSRCAAAASLI